MEFKEKPCPFRRPDLIPICCIVDVGYDLFWSTILKIFGYTSCPDEKTFDLFRMAEKKMYCVDTRNIVNGRVSLHSTMLKCTSPPNMNHKMVRRIWQFKKNMHANNIFKINFLCHYDKERTCH